MKTKSKLKPTHINNLKNEHVDLTKDITVMCLMRQLNRLKAQIKYCEKKAPEQIRGWQAKIRIVRHAMEIIQDLS